MKSRNGFVSNSSSSSFIVAIRNLYDPCPTCGRSGNDFLKRIEQASDYNDDYRVNGVGIEHVLWKYNNNDWCIPSPKKLKTLEKYKGNTEWTVVDFTLSNHDEDLQGELNKLLEEGNAELLF